MDVSRGIKNQNARKVFILSDGQQRDPEPVLQIIPIFTIHRPKRPHYHRPHNYGGQYNNYYHHRRPDWHRPPPPRREWGYYPNIFEAWRDFEGFNVTVENYVTNNITVNTSEISDQRIRLSLIIRFHSFSVLNNTSARSFLPDRNGQSFNDESRQDFYVQPYEFQLVDLESDDVEDIPLYELPDVVIQDN